MVPPVTWQPSTKLECFYAKSHYYQFLWEHKKSFNILATKNRYQPFDENCIYSTLKLIMDQSKSLNILVQCVTFHQHVWIKTAKIIKKLKSWLGGFHTMMNFLGSISSLRERSGIEKLFAEMYAENTVVHMMSGKIKFPKHCEHT